MVEARQGSGVFDSATTAEARRRLGGHDGSGGEGLGRVGWAFWRVLLQDLPLTPVPNGEGGDIEMVDVSAHPQVNGTGINGNGAGSVDRGITNGEPSRKVKEYLADSSRYRAIDRVLDRRGPWTDEQFVGGSDVRCDVPSSQVHPSS